jgi:serine/threonine-protein kinase
MEYVEGPDLEELLQPPHEPVFSIKEIIKIAEHLSNALAHCHGMDVLHGDVKSNNVKYNVKTGSYVLLDFGLAAMSDEQRRSSFRHAGAIEFMAPEQSNGLILPQTDVYGFGIILYELIAGSVPFPLKGKTETARNEVAIAHLETPPPDVLSLRLARLPQTWTSEKIAFEMQLPQWLTAMVSRCLEKKPENRFKSGKELHEYVCDNSTEKLKYDNKAIQEYEQEISRLKSENQQLQHQLQDLKKSAPFSTSTTNSVTKASAVIPNQTPKPRQLNSKKRLAIAAFILLVLLAFAFLLSPSESTPTEVNAGNEDSATANNSSSRSNPVQPNADEPDSQTTSQLQSAKQFFSKGKIVEALIIYNTLAKQQVPEAMYYYAKLALQNSNGNLSCAEAFDLLKKAGDKGYVPAKRTLGFIYSFANDSAVLQQGNYYNRCSFTQNIPKGSKLLMEAILEGDTAAGSLIQVLNSKQTKP